MSILNCPFIEEFHIIPIPYNSYKSEFHRIWDKPRNQELTTRLLKHLRSPWDAHSISLPG